MKGVKIMINYILNDEAAVEAGREALFMQSKSCLNSLYGKAVSEYLKNTNRTLNEGDQTDD